MVTLIARAKAMPMATVTIRNAFHHTMAHTRVRIDNISEY
jgi:hypothetical protein